MPERHDILRLLLAAGADANLNDGLRSPLTLAVAFQDKEAVQILLDAGAKTNQVFPGWIDEDPCSTLWKFRRLSKVAPTALCGAVASANYALVKLLLKAEADPNLGPHRDCTEPVKFTFTDFSLGFVEPSSPWVKRAKGKKWLSPLVIATKRNGIGLSKILLRAGADPNAIPEDNSAISALAVAAFNGNLDHCKLLIDAGANLNLPPHACFRNVLFAAISGCEHFKTSQRKSASIHFSGDTTYYERPSDYLSPSDFEEENDSDPRSESGQATRSECNAEDKYDSEFEKSIHVGESISDSEYDSADDDLGEARVDEERYSAVILLFMQKGMELPMPIYSSIGTVAFGYYRRAGESFHAGSIRAFHPSGQFDQFKSLAPEWFRILWALGTSPSPRLPPRSRLERCGFPRPLPHSLLLVLRFISPAKQRIAWAATIAINGDCSTSGFGKYRVQLRQR